ncbi:MAG: hypothetical protein IJ879_13090, partial [Muribaculaceae bacterium]|nr:hypothetical protein [Muribaculaceae bacterium]
MVKKAVLTFLVKLALILGGGFLLLVNRVRSWLVSGDFDIKQLNIFLIEVPDVVALLDITANKQYQGNEDDGGDQVAILHRRLGRQNLGIDEVIGIIL